ncbi:MAG: hypothetical protein ACRC2K_09890 [Clostridium sp.]
MRISTGSIIQFDINFTIPPNTNFNHITVSDSLSPGLNYITGLPDSQRAKLYVNGSTLPILISSSPFSDSTSTNTDVLLTLSAPLTPTIAQTSVKTSIPIKVVDASALFSAIRSNPTIVNLATISAYSASNALLAQTTATTPLNTMKNCHIYSFGGSYLVQKVEGAKGYLLGNVPAVGSFGTPDLNYVISVTANDHLTIPKASLSRTRIFVGAGNETSIPSAVIDISGPNTVTLTVPHIAELKSNEVFFAVPFETRSSITKVTDSLIVSYAECDLVYFNGTNNVTVCHSPSFTIDVLLTTPPPALNN